MTMRKLIAFLLVSGLLLGVANAGPASRVKTSIQGKSAEMFSAVVCSSFANNATTGGYRLLSLPSGFTYFGLVRICPVSPGAAQTFGLRFWTTTADSGGGFVTVSIAQTSTGEAFNQYFPINCVAVSVSLIDATDDFTVECYAVR
jgi:hypothetical protein